MSMLADILSKVPQPASKREVPPNLKNIVKAASGLSAYKKKIIILSAIFIVSVLSGIFFLQYVKSLSGESDIIISSTSPDIVRRHIREEQPVTSESSGLPQSGNHEEAGKLNEAPEETQPAMSGKEPVGILQEEGTLLPKVISRNEDNGEVRQRLAGKPDGNAPVDGSHQKAGVKDAAAKPDEPINNLKPDNHPSQVKQDVDTYRVDAYLYGAREYEMKGDYSKALVNYKKALEMDRSNYAVINNIAYIYLRLNLVDESIAYSRMALDINKDNPPALINLGIAYARSGDMTSAKECLNNAFRLEPDNRDVILNLAILHERQGQFQEAAGYFTRLVKSGDMDGALGLARVYEKQGQMDGAIKLYRNVYEHKSADDKMKTYARQRMILLNNRK